jgi:hypothetical protein
MIRHDRILKGIKALLDADTTLETLLGSMSGDSKVITGLSRKDIVYPWISLAILTHDVEIATKYEQITFVVIIHTAKESSGEYDLEVLSAIAERVDTLIDEKYRTLSVIGTQFDQFYFESCSPAADEGESGCFQTLSYRLQGKKIT